MEVKHRASSGVPSMPDEMELTAGVENVDPIEIDNANTLVVIEFSGGCPEETKDWLEGLISSPGKFNIVF